MPAIKRQSEEESQTERPVPGGTERILFVDDGPMLADLGEQVFKSLGYEMATRTSSTDALELFRKHSDSLYHGRIEVQRESGKGSVFTVYLPFRHSSHKSLSPMLQERPE